MNLTLIAIYLGFLIMMIGKNKASSKAEDAINNIRDKNKKARIYQ